MHKLDRTRIARPACLDNYDYRTQTWDDFKGDCKRAVRFALARMQGIPGVTTEDAAEYGVRCAYCEGLIFHEGHIEHFRRKNLEYHPEHCFDWHNLFLACGAHQHCGHYKDRKGAPPYDPAQLIKPDDHDPDDYLYFHSSGEVRIQQGSSDAAAQRARETIRVFGLNNPALVAARARAVSTYKARTELEELMSWDEADRIAYLQDEIEATRWDAYATTIRHFLKNID